MRLWLEMWHQVSRTCAYAQVRLLPSRVSSLFRDHCERNLTGDVLPSASRQWLLSVSLCLCNSRLQQSAHVFVFSLLSSSTVLVWLALCWLVNALALAQDIELRRKTCCMVAEHGSVCGTHRPINHGSSSGTTASSAGTDTSRTTVCYRADQNPHNTSEQQRIGSRISGDGYSTEYDNSASRHHNGFPFSIAKGELPVRKGHHSEHLRRQA